jgi:hypothetical protein
MEQIMTFEEQMAELDKPPLPIIIEATDAYFRDQQELLAHRAAHPGERWVAYHGNQRVGIGTSKRELICECLKRGIPKKQLLVLGIDPTIKRFMESTRG